MISKIALNACYTLAMVILFLDVTVWRVIV